MNICLGRNIFFNMYLVSGLVTSHVSPSGCVCVSKFILNSDASEKSEVEGVGGGEGAGCYLRSLRRGRGISKYLIQTCGGSYLILMTSGSRCIILNFRSFHIPLVFVRSAFDKNCF